MTKGISLTGVERTFDEHELIVSKTDTKGRITYANDIFLNIADYSEEEVLGQPHSVIRHPDMPRAVFKLLWDNISQGNELFAYVLNRTKFGDHYWVLAHVTPTYGDNHEVIGYHSSRRRPTKAAVDKVIPLYKQLKSIEDQHSNAKDGMNAAYQKLIQVAQEKGGSYGRFVLSL